MKSKIDDENNIHIYISLDKDDLNNVFTIEREIKMLNIVLLYSNRELNNYDAESKLGRMFYSVVKQDNIIYVRDKKSNKRFHFKFQKVMLDLNLKEWYKEILTSNFKVGDKIWRFWDELEKPLVVTYVTEIFYVIDDKWTLNKQEGSFYNLWKENSSKGGSIMDYITSRGKEVIKFGK